MKVHFFKENFGKRTFRAYGEQFVSELKNQRILGIFPKYKYLGSKEGF